MKVTVTGAKGVKRARIGRKSIPGRDNFSVKGLVRSTQENSESQISECVWNAES